MADESLLQVARIAAGEFIMGADDGEDDERPAHRIYVDDFAIGLCPVTNAEYAQFVRETGHPSPAIRALPVMVSGALESDFRSRIFDVSISGKRDARQRLAKLFKDVLLT